MKQLYILFTILLLNSCFTTHNNNSIYKDTSFSADKLYFERNGTDKLYVYELSGINTISYTLTPE